MDSLLLDIRFAVRFLVRNKRSVSIAIACLACGIAMTTTVYGSVSPWVFKPLPWNEPEQLVGLSEVRHESPDSLTGISGPNYRDWVRESRSFSEIGAWVRTSLNLSTDDLPQRIIGARISASLFPLLDEAPILGRVFTPDEEVEGRNDVILLSHELWQQRFASDPDVIGRSVRMDGRSHTVVSENWRSGMLRILDLSHLAALNRELVPRAGSAKYATSHWYSACVRDARHQVIPMVSGLGPLQRNFARLFAAAARAATAAGDVADTAAASAVRALTNGRRLW